MREAHSDSGLPVLGRSARCRTPNLDSIGVDRRTLLSRYRIADAARRVVGVSCWVILLQGIGGDDPLALARAKIAKFAPALSRQTERAHAALKKARLSGHIKVETEAVR